MEIIRGKQYKAQKVCVYGPEGVGKSTFASKFPDPLFIDTEDSTTNMDVARLPKPSSWTMLRQNVDYVIKNPTICKTLVVDTADWSERLCKESITSIANVKGIEDFGWGKGYTYLEEEFGRLLNHLQDVIEVGINVVVNAHAIMKKIEQPEEVGGYDHWQMKLEKKTMPLLKEWADMILFANYKVYVINVDNQGAQKGKNKAQGGKRVMYTTHSPWWDAKNRHNLPDELPFEYKAIAHIFENVSSAPVQQAPSTTKQPINTEQQKTDKQTESINSFRNDTKQTTEQNTINDNGRNGGSNTNNKSIQEPPKDDLKGIPKALADLLRANNVTTGEIQLIVGKRGYYPANTPITNYDPSFISGVLVGAWAQVYNMVLEFRKENDIFTPVTDDDEIPRF